MRTLQIRRGPSANIPASAAAGELLYTTDGKKLYIGNGDGAALTELPDLAQLKERIKAGTASVAASSDWVGKVYFYIGASVSGGFTKNHFYTASEIEAEPGTYEWVDVTPVMVQANVSVEASDGVLSSLAIAGTKYRIISGTVSDSETAAPSSAAIKGYVDAAIAASKKGFTFAGYFSANAPSGVELHNDDLWYALQTGETYPSGSTFNVKRYSSSGWSESAESHTAGNLELWANLDNGQGYYWFGGKWNIIDTEVKVDGVTVGLNASGQIAVKEGSSTTGLEVKHVKTGSIVLADGETAANAKFISNAAVTAGLNAKVSIAQDAANSGKMLKVNASGSLELTDAIDCGTWS